MLTPYERDSAYTNGPIVQWLTPVSVTAAIGVCISVGMVKFDIAND